MNHLQQAADRERRAPIYWWLAMSLAMGAALVWLVWGHSAHGAVLLAIALAGAWAAPLVAFASLAAPKRATQPAPAPGMGSYNDWRRQARLLGRMLLYCEDDADLPKSVRQTLRAAREDLSDTFGAHPLRDDLERVCTRVREGAIHELKRWFWLEYRSRVQELREDYENDLAKGMGADERLTALQQAVENAAAVMIRRCMPRMLERERLACARDCAWLATETADARNGHRHSPIELAGALVVEWCDFSEPWLPARVLRRAVARLDRSCGATDADPEAAGGVEAEGAVAATAAVVPAVSGSEPAPAAAEPSANGTHTHRVRVRVRKGRRRHSHHYRGPSFVDILLSFGQWLRYSVRSWMLYR